MVLILSKLQSVSTSGPCCNIKSNFLCMGIPMSRDLLIFQMGILILMRQHLETALWCVETGLFQTTVASGASLKFGVQGASTTNWFSRVNGTQDNRIRLWLGKYHVCWWPDTLPGHQHPRQRISASLFPSGRISTTCTISVLKNVIKYQYTLRFPLHDYIWNGLVPSSL